MTKPRRDELRAALAKGELNELEMKFTTSPEPPSLAELAALLDSDERLEAVRIIAINECNYGSRRAGSRMLQTLDAPLKNLSFLYGAAKEEA